jgi:hypothetical protein
MNITWSHDVDEVIGTHSPYARSVASAARSLLITLLGDAVHAGKIDRNPAERRKGRRGRKRARGRAPTLAAQDSTTNVITPTQALCLADAAPCCPGGTSTL